MSAFLGADRIQLIRDGVRQIQHAHGHSDQGTLGHGNVLSDQDAVDVAEFFTHKPRPDFPGKVNDWPNRPKPKDARY
jgi:cytochrome c